MQIRTTASPIAPEAIPTTDPTANQPTQNTSPAPPRALQSSNATFPDTSTPSYQSSTASPNAAPQTRQPDEASSESDDPLKDIPVGSILDPATDVGLPDLTQLPKPGADNRPDFERKSHEYWEASSPGEENRRTDQQVRLTYNLDKEISARVEAGALSPAGKAVVESFYKRPRDSAHGLYSVMIGTDPAHRSKPLNGIAIMTQKPAGYSYAEGAVKDRQESTGTTVLYMPGRAGTLQEFPDLKQALDWVNDRLRTDADFRATVLSRQTPQNRERLADAIHGGSPTATAGLMDGQLPNAMVDSQINAWKTSMLSDRPESFAPELGLDVSRSDESRVLDVDNANTKLIRDRLPPQLKNLQLNEQDKQTLKTWADENEKQRGIAHSYYGDVPDFAHYADDKIQQQILKDKGVTIDPSAITVTIPTLVSVPSGKGQGNVWQNGRSIRVPLSQLIAQRMFNTAPMTWEKNKASFTGPGADKLDVSYVESLSDQLPLEEDYDKLVHKTFERPNDPEDALAHDIGKDAALKASASSMRFNALIAQRSGDLHPHDYQMVQDVIDHPEDAGRPAGTDGNVTHAYGLVLNGGSSREGISMRDVTVFAHDGEQRIVVHTPNAPDGKAFRAYASRPAFMADMRGQLASIKNEDAATWSPMAAYWASQFGSHQIKNTLPWLRQVADGKGGAGLNNVRIDGDFLQNQYDYRTRHLLADADASAMTDNEVTLENGLQYAKAAYRVASMAAPPMITAPLDAAEVAYNLFDAYQHYNNGDKTAASHSVVEALLNLPGAVAGVHGAFKTFNVSRPLTAASNSQVRFQAPTQFSPDAAGFFSPFSAQSRYGGLYVKEGNLYARLKDGRYYPAYVDRGTGIVRKGEPRARVDDPFPLDTGSHPMMDYPFYQDPELRRTPGTMDWEIADTGALRLRGGGKTQSKLADADSDTESVYELASESMWTPPITPRERTILDSGKLSSYHNSTIKLGTYDRINTFKYPIRNTWDVPLYVKSIDPEGTGRHNVRYGSDAVLPYVDRNLTPDRARALYDKVYYRTFTKDDVKNPGEQAMIGQGMVVANRHIKKGEIVGVYGGRIVLIEQVKKGDPFIAQLGYTRNDFQFPRLVTDVPIRPTVMSGDNIMSRMNTNFDYDASGRPIRQSEGGYNVEPVEFKVTQVHAKAEANDPGSQSYIKAFFATEDIPAGTELRWNYGYKKESFDVLFPQKAT